MFILSHVSNKQQILTTMTIRKLHEGIKKILPDTPAKFTFNLYNYAVKPDPELFSSDLIESDYVAPIYHNQYKSVSQNDKIKLYNT